MSRFACYYLQPQNGKVALGADKIPGGPTIQAGDTMRWRLAGSHLFLDKLNGTDDSLLDHSPIHHPSDWQMGRDPSIWGPDCGEFKPERWIDEAGRIKQFGQFKFHAFNVRPSSLKLFGRTRFYDWNSPILTSLILWHVSWLARLVLILMLFCRPTRAGQDFV